MMVQELYQKLILKLYQEMNNTSTAVAYSDSIDLNIDNIDMNNFTPYNELTQEEQVIQFVQDKLGEEFNKLRIVIPCKFKTKLILQHQQ
jgi:hypothetical protein